MSAAAGGRPEKKHSAPRLFLNAPPFMCGSSQCFQLKSFQPVRKALVTSPDFFHPVNHIDILLAPCPIAEAIAGSLSLLRSSIHSVRESFPHLMLIVKQNISNRRHSNYSSCCHGDMTVHKCFIPAFLSAPPALLCLKKMPGGHGP